MSKISQEKRKSPRYCISQLLKVSPLQEEYLWAQARDFSTEGFSAYANDAIEPLTPIYAMIDLHPGTLSDESQEQVRTIRFEGYVAWATMLDGRCEFGTTITKISAADRAALSAWLADSSEVPHGGSCQDKD